MLQSSPEPQFGPKLLQTGLKSGPRLHRYTVIDILVLVPLLRKNLVSVSAPPANLLSPPPPMYLCPHVQCLKFVPALTQRLVPTPNLSLSGIPCGDTSTLHSVAPLVCASPPVATHRAPARSLAVTSQIHARPHPMVAFHVCALPHHMLCLPFRGRS